MLGEKRENLTIFVFDALNLATDGECLVSVGGGGVQTEEQKEEERMTLEEGLDGTTFNWEKRYSGFGNQEMEQDQKKSKEGHV